MNPATKLRTTVVMVFAAMALIAVPSSAFAHKKTYATSTTAVAQNQNTVDGQLGAVPRCLNARTVSVKSLAGVVLATTKSDSTGKWQIKAKLDKATSYYAVVNRKRVKKTRRHNHLCRSVSTTFTVG